MNRRKFIKLSGLSTAGLTLGMPVVSRSIHNKSSNNLINIGIIGTGDRGDWIVYLAKSVPDIRITACCDILPSHLENGLKEATKGAHGYSDYRKLLDNKDLDAVIIATPLHLHYRMAVDTLDAGKHVFCEKTMTYNIEQAIDLEQKVIGTDLIFQVGYQTRNNPLIQSIKQMIQNEYCGRLTHVRCNYHRNGNWRRPVPDPDLENLINWRMYWKYSGGLMAELCSHHIDLTNWMLDSHPLKVTGFGGVDYWKDGRETFDNVNTVYEYPNGVKAMFTSITTNAHYDISLQFMGTLGTIEINNEEGQQAKFYAETKLLERQIEAEESEGIYGVTAATYQAWKKGEGTPIKVENQPKGDEETTGLALRHFAECIQNEQIPVSNVRSGRQSSIAVHMANKAMRESTIEYWHKSYGN